MVQDRTAWRFPRRVQPGVPMSPHTFCRRLLVLATAVTFALLGAACSGPDDMPSTATAAIKTDRSSPASAHAPKCKAESGKAGLEACVDCCYTKSPTAQDAAG